MADDSQPAAPGDETNWEDFWCLSQDGLNLYARDYGPRTSRLTPVVCIPGLTRTSRDFHLLATHLATRLRRRRRILALDLRGRGRSDYDRHAGNYTPQREMLDVLDIMAAAGIERAMVIGTSRGGLIAMAMAAARPNVLAGVVLNDIGPHIEILGLMRIIGQLGHMPRPRSWDDATALMRRMFQDSFTDLSEEDWSIFAREVFRDVKGRPRPDFDTRIVRSLSLDDLADGAVPDLWPLYGALAVVPVLAIRGANSDIVSPATFARMAARHPDFTSVTVPNRGHAPFLREPVALEAIDALINRVDHRAVHG